MFKNLGLKFIALCLAIIFWISVVALKNNIKPFKEEVLIEPFNIAENLTLANPLGGVHLKIETSQETFSTLSVNDFEAYIDLKGFEAGEYNVPIQVTSKNPKVKVVKFEPANINISLEAITSKVLNVLVEVKGSAADNFEAKEAVFDLEKVEIKGPQNIVERATAVKAIVTLKGSEMSDLKTEVTLFGYDDHSNQLHNLEITPSSIEVMIPVIQIQKYKTVGIRANLTGDLAENYFIKKIQVSPSTVVLQGKTNKLSQIDYIETEEFDITNLDHNTLKRLNLKLPEGVTAQELQSVLVNLEINQYK